MNNPQRHPDQDTLTEFGLGRLDPPEASWIEEHLSECKECCDTLLNLKDDTFAGMVRTLPKDEGLSVNEVASEPPAETAEQTDVDTAGSPRPADDSVHAATMLVQSGDAVESSELPDELKNHPRYRIVERIGSGGMGDVFRGEHRLMNRSVALKLINSQLIRHPQAVERFRREVQAAAQLAHPNIVAAYDAERAGDVHFLAMEFVEGTDLSDVIERRGPLPVAEACDYIRQAALGLQHAHEKGMVHRDIKPHNLMLSPDGQVRILDFGLAGFATESAIIEADATSGEPGDTTPLHLTTMGSVMGTPDYIAPEQARDAHSADIRADIYSLGCTLYCLLTGGPPHQSDSVVEKLKAHAEREPEAIEAVRVDVPEELAEVIRRMMSKDPAKRFQTPAEVADALAPFVGHETQPQFDSGPPRRPIRPLVLWAGIATLLAAVIYVATTKGNFEVRSEVDGVKVTVSRDGDQFRILDVNSGTSIFWLPADGFEVTAKADTAVTVSRENVRVSWMGRQIIQVKRAAETKNAQSPLPKSISPDTSTVTPHLETAILTNPPSVPSVRLPTGENLIGDPSLEGTKTGQLPKEWSAWLDDGPEFKCKVVEGGVTGKHCLRISGTGKRGVVFCTSIPMDRTKRYALKGHVKVEGDAGTWAVIKLNYFNRTGWLGVDDRVGVKSGESGWKFLQKTDRANAFPEATLIVPTCHIEGNGTAWFDDLEVIAFDRNNLPEDFDKKHGKNNRMYSLD